MQMALTQVHHNLVVYPHGRFKVCTLRGRLSRNISGLSISCCVTCDHIQRIVRVKRGPPLQKTDYSSLTSRMGVYTEPRSVALIDLFVPLKHTSR
jgi:hypothetical protein